MIYLPIFQKNSDLIYLLFYRGEQHSTHQNLAVFPNVFLKMVILALAPPVEPVALGSGEVPVPLGQAAGGVATTAAHSL